MSLPVRTLCRQDTAAEDLDNSVNLNGLFEIMSPGCDLHDGFGVAAIQINLARTDDEKDFSK
jgi:hypothetical protein